MNQARTTQTLWSQCWDPGFCVWNPFGDDPCFNAHICVSIIYRDSTLYLDVSIDGHGAEFELTDGCIPAFSVGIASLNVCASNIRINEGELLHLDLQVKACIGVHVLSIDVEKCWVLFEEPIDINYIDSAAVAKHNGTVLRSSVKNVKYPVLVQSQQPKKPCNC
jgi:hypothetical protein